MSEIALEFNHVAAQAPSGCRAENVSLKIQKGEILSVLGDTDGGGEALFQTLRGCAENVKGDLWKDGTPIRLPNARKAAKMGLALIGISHRLSPSMTLLQHALCLPGQRGSKKNIWKAAEEISRRYQLNVALDIPCGELSPGEKLKGETLLALLGEMDTLVYNAIENRLTLLEMEQMASAWRQMAAEKRTVLFFTRFPEYALMADRCAIFRKGALRETVIPKETDGKALSALAFGENEDPLDKREITVGSVALEVRDLIGEYDAGDENSRGVSFEARYGEVTVVLGLPGNGQWELACALSGMDAARQGRIRLNQRDITALGVRERMRLGMGFAPGAKLHWGLSRFDSAALNMALRQTESDMVQEAGFLRYGQIFFDAENLMEKMNAYPAGGERAFPDEMSDAEKERIALIREIGRNPTVLLALSPTEGMAEKDARAVWNDLLSVRNFRQSVVVITQDPREAMTIGDRILVLYRGEIAAELEPKHTSLQELGLYMAGGRRQGMEDRFDEE